MAEANIKYSIRDQMLDDRGTRVNNLPKVAA